ncbi:MAG TPA: PQQ-binding-like beta-propeller repeat protein, partial [Pirellulales bacterium]
MCCASPVIGEGRLFLAAWSPGEDMQLPAFDALLKESGDEPLGHITRDGLDRTMLKGFFDNQDFNHDEKLTRDEWDSALKFMKNTKNSAFALKPGGSGDVTTSHVVWRKTKGLPYVPSVLFYRGQCLTVKDGGIVTAFDAASGDELYTKRVGANGRYYASPVAANGHIYLTSLDDGTITVMKAGTDKPEVVAKNELQERIAATPAIANDVLYVRTAGHIYAFGEGK